VTALKALAAIAMGCALVVLIACSDSSEAETKDVSDVSATPAETAVATKAEPVNALADDPAFIVGKQVYARNCLTCHQATGKGIPPAFPAIAGSAVVLGDINAQIELVLNGVSGSAMVPFGPQLSDEDVAAVITYQRNAFGNATGDVVTPGQVAALR